MRRISLRLRLVAGLVAVVLIGLIAADVATYTVVHNFLVDRVDDQLQTATAPALGRLGRATDTNGSGNGTGTRGIRPTSVPGAERTPFPTFVSGIGPRGQNGVNQTPQNGQVAGPQQPGTTFRAAPPNVVPPGTYGELRSPDGSTTSNIVFAYDSAYSPPLLPAAIASLPAENGAETFFSVDATDHTFEYRVRAQRLPEGAIVLTAIPLTELNNTLNKLRLTESAVSIGVVLVLATLAFWLVRLGLRPLDSIADVAGEIAAGNLTRRIEHTDSRTEIGRLGTSLNQMLASLEHAFAEQQASEEQLRRFLADASHELRTPLTSIRGYAELFKRGANERPADLEKVLRRVDEESQRMSVLVDELLLLARLRQSRVLERNPVDLTRIASDAVDDARVLAPGRPIEFAAQPPVMVDGDDGRLRQVMANLIGNALHHTPPDEKVEVTVRSELGNAILEVADTGPGLAPEEAAHVFEPFYRVDKGRARSAGGTGLGLAIVKAIVESHGGTVSVRTNSPHGAIFHVALPR